MKKTINININGIVFSVEEDAYELLNSYLESIKKYFSSYEESSEIISDIEARIGEIFSEKLSAAKQSISIDDVKNVIASMGSVADFEQFEKENSEVFTSAAQESKNSETGRRLLRDEKRKILGGVCSGLAYYFKVDAFWIRLAFVLLFFGLLPFSKGISGGFFAVCYLILWIAMPGVENLPEVNTKKLMRNPDGQVLGGVANGIASYFGVDVAIVRILFVVCLFVFGSGVLAYIIIWAITPEAKTITEKMQMKGDPITLNNIEKSVKEQLNLKDINGEESFLTKMLLLPFRAVSGIFKFLSNSLKPMLKFLIGALRVLFGLFTLVLSLILIFALSLTFAVSLGIITNTGSIDFLNFPVEIIMQGIPVLAVVSTYICVLIPLILAFILSISLLSNKFLVKPILGWTLLSVWILSVIGLGYGAVNIANLVKEKGVVKMSNTMSLPADKVLFVGINKVEKAIAQGDDFVFDFNNTQFTFTTTEDSLMKITQKFTSRGKNTEDAEQNAKLMNYSYSLTDSILILDDKAIFGDKIIYRGQNLSVEIAIPVGQKIYFDPNFQIVKTDISLINNIDEDFMYNNYFVAEKEGFKCLSCEENKESAEFDYESDSTFSDKKEFDISDFKRISASTPLQIKITPSDKYEIVAYGKTEALEKLKIYKEDDVLFMEKKKSLNFSNDYIIIEIKMPEIEKIKLMGATSVKTGFFDNNNNIKIEVLGASDLKISGNFSKVNAEVVGASKLQIKGSAKVLKAEVAGASSMDCSQLKNKKSKVECVGASNAKVNCENGECFLEAFGASHIEYSGDADEIEADGSSSVKEN